MQRPTILYHAHVITTVASAVAGNVMAVEMAGIWTWTKWGLISRTYYYNYE